MGVLKFGRGWICGITSKGVVLSSGSISSNTLGNFWVHVLVAQRQGTSAL